MSKKNTKGFTIIELLIVIAIIGILAAVTLSSLNTSRLKADDAKRGQDMTQVKTALELYAEKNSYNLPILAQAVGSKVASESADKKIFSFFATPVYASGHTEPACVQFDQLAQILVSAGYLSQIPKDPSDAPTDSCYKAYSVDTDGDSSTVEAVTGYAILWEKYETQTDGVYGNKKVGFISSGKTEVTGSLMAQVCTTTGEFPVFDLSSTSNLCTRNPSDAVADKVLGVTGGVEYASNSVASSDTPSTGGHCSNPAYSTQTECEKDRSFCSNNTYTNQESCEANGVYSGGSCSGGSFTSESGCVSAGYYSPEPGCSGGNYVDQFSCENAIIEVSPGSCSSGAHNDQSSCENAMCTSSAAYCSDYTSTDQYVCEANGGTWYPEQLNPCGYTWTPSMIGSAGYTWSDGVFYSHSYTWYPGTYTPYTWTNVPPSTWYQN